MGSRLKSGGPGMLRSGRRSRCPHSNASSSRLCRLPRPPIRYRPAPLEWVAAPPASSGIDRGVYLVHVDQGVGTDKLRASGHSAPVAQQVHPGPVSSLSGNLSPLPSLDVSVPVRRRRPEHRISRERAEPDQLSRNVAFSFLPPSCRTLAQFCTTVKPKVCSGVATTDRRRAARCLGLPGPTPPGQPDRATN
jgi:hypothetical protein